MSVLIGTLLDDTLTGTSGEDNTLVGDASAPLNGNTGGDDLLRGGANGANNISGDSSDSLINHATGGDDAFTGGANSNNFFVGDGRFLTGGSKGGDDVMTGSDGATSVNTFMGDAAVSLDGSVGGDDTLIGGAGSLLNNIFGDAGNDLVSNSTGGDDTLTGGADSNNVLFGDAGGNLLSGSHGGDDVITGGANSTNSIFGDARTDLESDSTGGDDTLTGGANSNNTIRGDAGSNLDHSVGGDDRLIGGANSTNRMYGDAESNLSHSIGGDDTLIAGDSGTNTLFGDAQLLLLSTGGDDRLVSGTGTDDMWGDANVMTASVGGRDVFAFGPDNGNDTIHDFERGKDLIDVSAVLSSFASASLGASSPLTAPGTPLVAHLTIEERDVDRDGKVDSIIHVDARNSVTVLGVTGLADADFITSVSSSYVLFSRTSTGGGHRDDWVGSEANSLPSDTPGSHVPRSAFDADTATGAGTVLAGPAAADYAADGILTNANVAMFDLTEAAAGGFATGAADDLAARIAAGSRFFGTANTDLDPSHSQIDVAAGKLHLAQIDKDWNGIKNLEISLDSGTTFREIRLENFVDTRLELGDAAPDPDQPLGERFDVRLLGSKRGEVDASHAPQAMDLLITMWSNSPSSQNSFDVKGTVFDDTVTIQPGEVVGSVFGEGFPRYIPDPFPEDPFDRHVATYMGGFTTVFADLGDGADRFDSGFGFGLPHDGGPFIQTRDVVRGGGGGDDLRTGEGNDTVWGGGGDDVIRAFRGDDKLFGDDGSVAPAGSATITGANAPGNDQIFAGEGADWIEGDGDGGVVVLTPRGPGELPFLDLSLAGDRIDCGEDPHASSAPDRERDVINFNAGDGFDVVVNFGAGIDLGPVPPIHFVQDVLRIENLGELTTQVVETSEALGTLVQNGAGSVFLAGVTVPLAQSTDGKYLLLFDSA